MSIIAWVFARGGSRGLSCKNLRLLAGKPLLGHAIEAAQAATLVDAMIVSTDDEKIAETTRCWGAEVLMRPTELATDEAPEWGAWQHAVRERKMTAADIFVSVPCTSPLRWPEDIDACIRALIDSDADAAITVHTAPCHPWWDMMEMDPGGYVRLMVPPVGGDAEPHRRQDVPIVYVQNDIAHAARPEYILSAESELRGRVRAVVLPAERALDIHTEHDLIVAEALMMRRLLKEENRRLAEDQQGIIRRALATRERYVVKEATRSSTEMVGVRVPAEVKSALEQIAEADGRPLVAVARDAFYQYLADRQAAETAGNP